MGRDGRVRYASRIFTKNIKIADISKQFMEKTSTGPYSTIAARIA